MIGLHLIIDGVFEPPLDRETVEALLSELPGVIGMHILHGPEVVRGCPENPGWTGFVIIDKSHISIHTFDVGSSVSVDVFSCQPFDAEEARRFIEGKIVFRKLRMRTLTRSED
jgi:S-adenosylmethionine decarboxylase